MKDDKGSPQKAAEAKGKQKKTTNTAILIVVCVVVIIALASAIYFSGLIKGFGPTASAPTPGTPPPAPAAPAPATPTPAPSTPAAPVTRPPAPPPPPPAPAPSPQPAPAPKPVPAAPAAPGELVMVQASQLVLSLKDMGPGWMSAGGAAVPARQGAFSTSGVTYNKGSAFSPALQNTVTVYRTVDAATNAFEAAKPAATAAASVTFPRIGDQCFQDDTVLTNKMLVFRKGNVVVWITLQQDKTGDPQQYAAIVEQKITP